MAADYIAIPRTNRPPQGNEIVSTANVLADLRDRVNNLNAIGARQWDTGDYSVLAAQTGVPAGVGANFLTLLGQLTTLLNTNATVAEYISRLAGQ